MRFIISEIQCLARIHRAAILGCIAVVIAPASAGAGTVPDNKPANCPDWWFSRGVILHTGSSNRYPQDYAAPDDYAAANIGQLKQFAVAAMVELDENLPIGSGTAIHLLVDPWVANPAQFSGDYSVVNLGQLKEVASLFFARLQAAGYNGQPISSGSSSWGEFQSSPLDTTAANLGQLKEVFCFDVNPGAVSGTAGM